MSDHVQAVTHDRLVRELCKVTEWDVLGIYLGLDESEITEIERDHQNNARRRIAMLAKWIEKDTDASWQKVIEALECMSQIRLANQLKEKYYTTGLNLSAAGAKSAECSPEKELTVDRQALIVREIEDLEEKFLLLVTSVHLAMAEANLSLIRLQMFSKFYTKSKVSTVEELFDLLEPYYFLEYALLEKIVKFFLSRSTVADDLRDYLHQLAKFKTSTTIEQFIKSIEQAQQSHSTTPEGPGLCTVKLRLVGGWLDRTMDDLEKLVNEIFQEKRYVLTHLKIVRGSVIVTYSAPLSEVDSLICLLLEQSQFLIQVGVSLLVVADTVITHNETLDFSFESSLLGAIEDNNLDLVTFLLKIHTNPNATDSNGQTALIYGIDSIKVVGLLLKANADPNLQTKYDKTPLYVASQKGHDDIIALLLKANANPNFRCSNGATALFIASQNGHTNIISLLLKAKADPNLQCDDGTTPLCIASHIGHTDIISLLLKANADPNLQRNSGATPLYIASQNGHTEVISLLLKANANPNLRCSNGSTPLYIASQKGHTDVISLLLKADTDPNFQLRDGTTPLYIASQKGHTDIISLLLKANADPNLQCDDGTTPLCIASQKGYTDIISLLLKANADPNLQRSSGATSLYVASQKGHTDVISLLLKANADPNLQCNSGVTPLYFASQNGHTDVISLLLKANADPNLQRVRDGATPLCIASQNGHTDAVSLLLKANADTSLGNIFTPLILAAKRNHSQIVQLLLDNGADPNVIKSSGVTALMSASHAGCLKSVELLLKSGADRSIVGLQGLTALDMAAARGYKDIVDLLQAFKCSQSSTTSQSVLTINEIASKIDNETMALINRAMEKLLVEKTETLITAEYQKLKRIALPPKHYRQESRNIL